MIDGLQVINSVDVVPFSGRSVVASKNGPVYCRLMRELVSTSAVLRNLVGSKRDQKLTELARELVQFTEAVSDPERELRLYEIELIQDVLLVYINGLSTRFHVDSSRFRQLSIFMQVIRSNKSVHPYLVLCQLDSLVIELSSANYMFASQLQQLLTTSTKKQWKVIIDDYRRVLNDATSVLFVIGLIGTIGWPGAMIVPSYKIMRNLMRVIDHWDKHHTLTPRSLFDLAVSFVMLYASMQIMGFLQVYMSFGIVCLVLSLFGSVVDDNTIKKHMPAVAPHIVQIDRVLSTLRADNSISEYIARLLCMSDGSGGTSSMHGSTEAVPVPTMAGATGGISGAGAGQASREVNDFFQRAQPFVSALFTAATAAAAASNRPLSSAGSAGAGAGRNGTSRFSSAPHSDRVEELPSTHAGESYAAVFLVYLIGVA
jgi:hypothetical protein